MNRFLRCASLYSLALLALLILYVVFRVMSYADQVAQSHYLEPWQKYLFLGDSHIGCTFVEEKRYCNKIIWEPSMPQQFTLMRLLDMERDGTLKNAKVVILDIGLQSIGVQRTERMKEFWWRMIPITWRYADLLPINTWDKLTYVAGHLNGRIHIVEEMPTNNVSILTRTQKERDEEFAINAETHFHWINVPEEMCAKWDKSLEEAIIGIVNVCKRNEIRLIFFTAPLTSYYRAAIPADAENKLQEFTNQIKNFGVEYYDLRDWGEDFEFRDCFHFTYDGAKRFTDRFYKEIVKPEY